MPRPTRRPRAGRAVLVTAASLLVLAGCAAEPGPGPTAEPSTAATAPPASSPAADEYAVELVALTNDVRRDEGLEELAPSECAREAALERAAALVGAEELEHAPLGPVLERCAPQTTAAENLVNSAATPAEVTDAWLGSPGHRANIVDPALTEIGIGCVEDDAALLCAQIFLGP
ncbi:CAP domain-containing protein [Georgenia sp. MJ170]|uniref:CAP domain-containing protein n=1 Tax=Georgenia sunbinii TaxID=3117728 RepID=UPI002F2609E8